MKTTVPSVPSSDGSNETKTRMTEAEARLLWSGAVRNAQMHGLTVEDGEAKNKTDWCQSCKAGIHWPDHEKLKACNPEYRECQCHICSDGSNSHHMVRGLKTWSLMRTLRSSSLSQHAACVRSTAATSTGSTA